LTYEQRTSIYDKTVEKVTKNYLDRNYIGTNGPERAREKRERTLPKGDPERLGPARPNLCAARETSNTGVCTNPFPTYRHRWQSARISRRWKPTGGFYGWHMMFTRGALLRPLA